MAVLERTFGLLIVLLTITFFHENAIYLDAAVRMKKSFYKKDTLNFDEIGFCVVS